MKPHYLWSADAKPRLSGSHPLALISLFVQIMPWKGEECFSESHCHTQLLHMERVKGMYKLLIWCSCRWADCTVTKCIGSEYIYHNLIKDLVPLCLYPRNWVILIFFNITTKWKWAINELLMLLVKWKSLSRVLFFETPCTITMEFYGSLWNSPGQNTGVGRISLLQGIFPTQGSNPSLPRLQGDLKPSQRDPNLSKCFKSFSSSYPHPWRRQWHSTPVLLPGKSHGQRSLVGCSPWGR